LVSQVTPQKRPRLIVGLGNPGEVYRATRHNAGFMVLEKLAATYGIETDRRKFNTLYGRGRIEDVTAMLVKPLAYMNNSGPPVRRLADYLRISAGEMLVIHDDIDLAFGRIKIKKKGGHGGHNGLRSLMDAFGSGEFARLRIGIGRSEQQRSVTDHVLGAYSVSELGLLDRIIALAQDAVGIILTRGITEAMNRFNDKRLSVES
jgi:PTH1 family peptidyl-tRNA hydrolase